MNDSSKSEREIVTSEPPSLALDVLNRTPHPRPDGTSGGKLRNEQRSIANGGEPNASTPTAHFAPRALSVQFRSTT